VAFFVEAHKIAARDFRCLASSHDTTSSTRKQTSNNVNENDNPLQVENFDHITLIVSDLDATREFYVNMLGMTESPRPDFDFPGAWFQVGSVQIHATVEGELAGMAGWGDRKVKSISRGHHFAFEVKDFPRAIHRLEELGVKIGDGPKQRPDGAFQVYFYDPDGHLVELFSAPPK
jgi:catechol 2,3-dioxygenase-like lactoylglutathione lyase family enzyme